MADKEARLATRIDPAVDKRLRTAAVVSGKRIGRLLSELLDEHLPSADELADRVRSGADDDHED